MMPRRIAAVSLVLALALAACEQPQEQSAAAHQATLDRYCTDCHNEAQREGDLVLTAAPLADPAAHADVFEKVVHKLSVGLMPPPGEPRPDAAATAALVGYLVDSLDAAAAARPDPGRFPLHRLNRAEYGNAIRDLLGVPVDVATQLPADSSSHGFDNVSDVLKTSPLLLDRYLAVGMRVAATAVGDTRVEPNTTVYAPPADRSHNVWIEGLPLGTRGGLVVDHYFPADAEYELKPELWEAAASTVRGLEGFEEPFELEVLVDGVPVHRTAIGGREDDDLSNRDQGSATAAVQERVRVRVPVTAGLHRIGVTFVMKSFAVDQRLLQPFESDLPPGNDAYGWPRIARLLVTGPYETRGAGDTPARRAIFSCRPSAALAARDCARDILARLARRAYSRPVTDDELGVLLDFYDHGAGDGGGAASEETRFERGVQLALVRMISGPEFLFRGAPAASAAPGEVERLDDVTLASRLALFLWSSIPDDELLDAAVAGKLSEPRTLERQVRRMLADARASALVTNFAEQWLALRNLPAKSPDLVTFTDWDDNLRQDMLRETHLLLEHVLLGDESVLDLVAADYTFLNERLAEHYGIDGVYGDAFRRVELADDRRRGLLGHGSILFETSVATRTSPVFRGKWIMTNIFNAPPAPPPPDVPALDDAAVGDTPLTVRERLARHTEDPACAACHATMDPAGFALENFDAIGRWRERDMGLPVDAAATLPDGSAVNGPAELRAAILARPEIFVSTLTQKLMTYALARGLEPSDMPAVRKVVRDAAAEEYRFSSIVLGVVRSVPFTQRKSE